VRFALPAAVVCFAASAVLVGNEPSPDVVAGTTTPRPGRSGRAPDMALPTPNPQPSRGGPGLSIRRIESDVGVAGAQDFVIVLDGPVPDDRITYVEDINNVDAPAVGYTTQEWTPQNPTPLRTCADTHFGFNPPVVVGQVDVLLPGEWFRAAPDTDEITWRHHPEVRVKTPLCGPHDGYVQFAIWEPASHDPDDIRVYFDGTTRLVVEIRPDRG
jgi:hypothetical protein